jgi:hypothetical protein
MRMLFAASLPLASTPLRIALTALSHFACSVTLGPPNEPRIFQLLLFQNKTTPTIKGKIDGRDEVVVLPRQGIWEFAMELLWSGGGIKFNRWVNWDERTLPEFCKPPKP